MESTKYEIMYIIHPSIDGEVRTALVERFDAILKDSGAEVIESRDWEKRRFVYEMDGYREGVYHIVRISSPSSANAVSKLGHLARINDDIIRHMIVKKEA